MGSISFFVESSEEAERKEVEKEEKRRREVKYTRSIWWTKRKEQISSFFVSERKECVKERGWKRNTSPRAKQVLGKCGRWLFLLLILMENWLCIDAAAGRLEPEGKAEVAKIIIVSDVVRGTKVDLDGKGLQEKQMEKLPKSGNRQMELTGLK